MLSLEYYLIIVISYFVGTFPSAYLLVRVFARKDVMTEGTGNAGAMNSYDVTGKRYVGVFVFIADAIKGAAAVLIAKSIIPDDFLIMAIATVWVVLGHNYNVFFKMKGGRGLAATVGALSVINPIGIALWALMWVMSYFVIQKDVHVANSIALIGTPILLFSTPGELVELTNVTAGVEAIDYKVLLLVLCLIILLRHLKPLIEKFKKGV